MAISPSPPPPVNPAMAEYPRIVVTDMAAPTSRDGLASGSSTLTIICQVDAPMDLAASMTPASTSFREDSTIRPMYGDAAIIRGTTVALEPMVFPTINLVMGNTMIKRIINGTERSRLMMSPRTLLNRGTGLMPSLSVTTRAIPRGMPIT